MPAVVYNRPFLYPKQERAFFTPKRYSFIEASTKAGKTVAAIVWIIEQALQGKSGQNYWWVAPIADQARIAFTRIKAGLTLGTFTPRESPAMRIDLINGTSIWFKSADNPDSLYGEDVYAAVVDEASRAKEESWNALRSTLTATQGLVRCIGNVKGRKNWFYRLSRLAESGRRPNMNYEKITVVDAIAAGVIPPDEIEDARATLPEHVFRELYFAEASDDGGNPFGIQHIAQCVRPGLSNAKPVAFGIDLAKKQDYFVIIGLDDEGQVCSFDRWQNVPWSDSIRRVWRIVGEDAPALVDSTGLGDPVLEELQRDHGNFRGYLFSAVSKQKLMEGLAVSIQSHEIGFPEGPIRQELDSFEYSVTRTGFRYSAPEGLHDDCVCALALARQQWAEGAPAASLMAYYGDLAAQAKDRAESANLSFELDSDDIYPTRIPKAKPPTTVDAENDLITFYESSIAQFQPEGRHCTACGQPLGANKVTNGVESWHPQCIGLGARAA